MTRHRTLLASLLLICCACAWLASAPGASAASVDAARRPRIQVAILLDTSNSMDGLIDQARNQLWQVVAAFQGARRSGIAPTLEVAVLEYGNSSLAATSGHVRQVVGLTSDLDRVSEALFGLTTNGGDEYCGYAIDVAARQLQWSTAGDDVRAIFIAGNEPFTQGPVSFVRAIEAAKQRGIVVNTIHAGPQEEGLATHWMTGAQLAGGRFLSIDPDRKTVHVEAPQDAEIARLNQRLNETYVPFGSGGRAAQERQVEQDARSAAISDALLAKRAAAKASAYYESSSWDLVDAVQQGKLGLDEVKESELPEALREVAPPERAALLEQKSRARKQVRQQIQALSAARDAFVTEQRRKNASDQAGALDSALIEAVVEQGKSKGFSFEPAKP